MTNTMLIRRCAQLEATTPADVTSAAVYTLRLLARRILELTNEIHDLIRHITDTITRHCLNRPGFRTPFRSWEGWRDARQEL